VMGDSAAAHNNSRNIFQIGRTVYRSEGLAGLYKGVGPPLISLTILNTTTFTQYAYFRELYFANPGWDLRNMAAGMSCAPVSAMVSTVENVIKTQMQLDNVKAQTQPQRQQFTSSWNCFTTLIRTNGFQIVYTGHVVNTIREMTFLGPYFFLYEGFRETFLHLNDNSTSTTTSIHLNHKVAVPVAGGLAGASSWFISFPLDCIRAGVQGQTLPPTKGAIQVCKELVQTRGIRGLYAGSSASIARAFLVSGSRFSAYEFALWVIRGGRHYEKHHD